MTEPTPPTEVTKRDGRRVAFDADRISGALFAATEEMGRPDALLARDLTEGVVHFLASKCEGQTPTTAYVAEVVVEVVRELGQPTLAAAFSTHLDRKRLGTSQIDARRQHSLSAVYSRDLTAAQEAGLLTLTDLAAPDTLLSRVCAPTDLQEAKTVALDGPDHDAALTDLARSLTNREAVVNLNIAEPPPWRGALAAGPLFASGPAPLDPAVSDAMFDVLLTVPGVRIDWHLGEGDFLPENRARLRRVVSRSRQNRICFVFDRPRRPVALGDGLTRRHTAALVRIDLHLPSLARQGGLLADVDRFVQQLGSLARLALSAAVQKREHLRKRSPELTRGFVLDRARLVVVPVGLDEVVRLYTDWGLANGGESLDLGRRIVARLLEVLRADGRSTQMESCLDGPALFDVPGRMLVPGLTPWADSASVSAQLRAAGALHAQAEQGTLALRLGADDEMLSEALEEAWRRTEVVRVRVV